jgi:hypothetical protein
MFLDPRDLQRLRSFARAEGADLEAVQRLLELVCAGTVPPAGDYIAVGIERAERELDLRVRPLSLLFFWNSVDLHAVAGDDLDHFRLFGEPSGICSHFELCVRLSGHHSPSLTRSREQRCRKKAA